MRSLALILALLLGGCGLLPEVKDETAGWSAQKLYAEAKDNLNSGNYERSVKLFETLEARFPYGRYAQQAILEGAYSSYRAGETPAATAALSGAHSNVSSTISRADIGSMRRNSIMFARPSARKRRPSCSMESSSPAERASTSGASVW